MLQITKLNYRIKNTDILDIQAGTMEPGKFTALMGPNGSGKSTLLKLIAGDLTGSGQILFHHKILADIPRRARARDIAVLPQASDLSFPFKVREVVALGAIPLALPDIEIEQKITENLRITDCLHLEKRAYPQLSGGEKQRVQLARVLLQISTSKNPLLLLDEPTSAQDLGQQHAILSMIRTLCEEKKVTVIAVLHDLNQVLKYCDSCWVINAGKLHDTGDPRTTLTPELIERFWRYSPKKLLAGEQTVLI
ncbi:heme ABC transporter ATP-binding protein [Simiduia litorea]|uniref:ATP-binding cassette domain-containing protein n=1 Tax=Simiduia litorea TaxID=1435348 RepID=UPI0036F352A9